MWRTIFVLLLVVSACGVYPVDTYDYDAEMGRREWEEDRATHAAQGDPFEIINQQRAEEARQQLQEWEAERSDVPPWYEDNRGLQSGCPDGCTTHLAGCDIKGNISVSSGEKIYHVPGQKYYAETRISPEYGERWFCTEAEARANGWRKALQ